MKSPILASLILAAALAAGSLPAPAASAARCQDVLRYLKADVEYLRNRFRNSTSRAYAALSEKGFVPRLAFPLPVVFFSNAPEATEMAKTETDLAVWSINKELPQDFQLSLGPAARSAKPERGMIKVVYMANEDWPKNTPRLWGYSRNFLWTNGTLDGGQVLLDHTRVTDAHTRVVVLLHELLHTLGRGHVDRDEFPDTIMHPKGSRGHEIAGHLRGLDKAALRAVYSPLVPTGTTVDTLRCDSQGRLRGSR